jgi:hypothetical protein
MLNSGGTRHATGENIRRTACWITKTTEADSEYVILIFPPRQ